MNVIRAGLIFLLAVVGALQGCACGREYFPARDLMDVPDEPLWQAELTETVGLRVENQVAYSVPQLDNWQAPFGVLTWPMFVCRENENLVIRGVHLERHWLWSPLIDYRKVDGVNRWVIGSDEIQTFFFPEQEGADQWIFAADLEENPGPEFVRLRTIWSGGKPGEGDIVERSFHAFDVTSRELVSVDMLGMISNLAVIHQMPIEYPDTSLFMYQEILQPENYRLIDFSGGGTTYLDPRGGTPDVPVHVMAWIASTGEWFCAETNEIGGVRQQDNVIAQPDGSVFPLQERTWPEFPEPDPEPYVVFQPRLAPFYWDGHRYLMFYTQTWDLGPDEREAYRWWAVRFDPGSREAEPIWCRDEPDIVHPQEQLITMGVERRPYWVRFAPHARAVRVIDLVSGQMVASTQVDIGPYPKGTPFASLVFRLEEDRDIPAIFIFDPNGGKLIQIDLEIAGEETSAE